MYKMVFLHLNDFVMNTTIRWIQLATVSKHKPLRAYRGNMPHILYQMLCLSC